MKHDNDVTQQIHEVRLYPDCVERHTSLILCGLIVLAQQGKIKLEISTRFSSAPRQYARHTLWMEATIGDGVYKVCFDMADGPQIASTDGLDKCDVYFKRSYDQQQIGKLIKSQRLKVHPFGLYYPVALPLALDTFNCRLSYFFLNDRESGSFSYRVRDAWSEFIKLILMKYHLIFGYEIPVTYEYMTGLRSQTDCRGIFFQTRVWESSNVPGVGVDELNNLNDARAQAIRSLKQCYGDRFKGGLFDTPFAREYYPDCVSNLPCDRHSYFKELMKAQIAITSAGLYRSIGAKLPEYFAAGKAVVTEPSDIIIQKPLVEGENVLYYTSPEECVEKCEILLGNPSLTARMQLANSNYFNNYLRPDNLIMQCFDLINSGEQNV